MTKQYTLDINHSTLLTSIPNANMVSCIKDVILNDVGLANLNKAIENADTVKEVLNLMASIIDSVSRNRQYLFDIRTGEHVFYINEGSTKLPARIKAMIASIPRDRTSIRYFRDDKLFIMRVNSRFYPLSGVTNITTTASSFASVFNGPLFIRRVSDRRFIPDSKELWELQIPEFRQTLDNMVNVVYTDLKRRFHSDLNPPDALFVSEVMLENLHTLMVLLRINHNLPKYEPRIYSEQLQMEALETAFNQYKLTKDAIDFVHVAIFMTGKMLERLVTTGYQHLLKGFLK